MAVRIKDIPILDRPVERLINDGVEKLNNEELLAIILKSGYQGASSKDVANILLSKIGDIKKLNEIGYEELKNIKGIGSIKACTLLSCIEIGRRINTKIPSIKGIHLNKSQLVYEYYKDKLSNKKQEYFYAIYLDNRKKVLGEKLLFIGTINFSIVHPREVFKEAYSLSSSAIILVHNHPGNNCLPSNQDIETTNNLIKAGEILGIKIIDHVIVCENNYYSFLENGDI